MLNVGEHLSSRFGYVWCSQCFNFTNVRSGVPFLHASTIFHKFHFRDSKEPRETRVIKLSQKLSILQHFVLNITSLKNNDSLSEIHSHFTHSYQQLTLTFMKRKLQNINAVCLCKFSSGEGSCCVLSHAQPFSSINKICLNQNIFHLILWW